MAVFAFAVGVKVRGGLPVADPKSENTADCVHRTDQRMIPGRKFPIAIPKTGLEEADMRIRLAGVFVLVLLGASMAHAEPQTYYLALGDSLAVGVQPSGHGDVNTNQGYADDLYALYRLRVPGLRLAKLGCSGETSTTMIQGGICYPVGGGQLDAAVAFLATHRVALITLDIGGDDVYQCYQSADISSCVSGALPTLGSNLVYILGRLRLAAGKTPIIAMNYYDPFLAVWVDGTAGKTLAEESVPATDGFNEVLEGVYGSFHVPVADVAKAFRVDSTALVPDLNIPVSTLLALTWTWMGAPAPFGPDIHPNAAGYVVIAGAFAKTIAAQ
jgi:lysophospholipase L1-like esterase